MKENSTTHKAEGLDRAGRENPNTKSQNPTSQIAERVAATGEEKFLESVMQFTRGLQGSRDPDIANAAREWEPIFNFRIRMTMQERKRRAKARELRLQGSVSATSPRPSPPSNGSRPTTLTHPVDTLSRARERGANGEGDGAHGVRRPTASPSGVHIQVSVSPNQD